MPDRRRPHQIVALGGSSHEAAAIIAAVQRFRHDTAALPTPVASRRDPWHATALAEGVERGSGC